MASKTELGFPKGEVAQTLRKILYPALTAHDAEAIVVCLMAHLLIEKKVNELLYQWLNQDAPDWKESNKISKARDGLWKAIIDMSFYAKYSLIEIFFFSAFSKTVRGRFEDQRPS